MSVCRNSLLNCALRNGGREFNSPTFRQYFISMEIRRCDKCNADIDPKQIEELNYYGSDDDGKPTRMNIPTILSGAALQEHIQAFTGSLDDQDEFGPTVVRKEVDLCYNCIKGLAEIIKTWFA